MLTDLFQDKMDRAFEAADLSFRLTNDARSKAAILSCYAAIMRNPNDAGEVAFDLKFFDSVFPVRMRRSDIFTLAEIFYDREYAIHTPLPDRPLVLDCGANVGLSTIWFLARFVGSSVHAFEPAPDNFRFLELNVGGRNDVVATQAAVGKTPGKVLLHVAEHGAMHSVRDATAGAGSINVDCINLADYLRDRSISRVDVLKLDVEGSEMEVVEGLGDRIDDVGVIVGEFHETLVDEGRFYGYLEKRGFRRVKREQPREAGVHLFELAR